MDDAAYDWGAFLRAPSWVGSSLGRPPTVSVLVPAYDAADTIGEALESALQQRPAPLEVVVSDDGSRDDLPSVLTQFPAVRLVRGANGGLAVARNRAAAVARGELLALLDADDVWLPGRVAALTAVAQQRPDLDIFTTDAVVVRAGVPEPCTYYGSRHFEVHDQVSAILQSNFIFGAGAVRAEVFRAVGGYSPHARYAEDWDLWLRLLLRGHRAGLVHAPLYEYRRRAGSLTGDRVELALGVLAALERSRPLLTGQRHRRQLDETVAEWRVRAAREAVRRQDPRARRLAVQASVSPGVGLAQRVVLSAAALSSPRLVTAARRARPRRDHLRRVASRVFSERPLPVGRVARQRRDVARSLRGLSTGSAVLAVGAGLAVRQARPGDRVDVTGTSPYALEVTVVTRADRPGSLPVARYDAVVVADAALAPPGRLAASAAAVREGGRLVLLGSGPHSTAPEGFRTVSSRPEAVVLRRTS